ncbi:RNA transcription, translation and transport factor protein [Dirofilaria immitis]
MMTSAPQSILKSVIDKSRYAQDEILQYVQLSPNEDYCIPSTARCFPEQYVRCQLSFEDPQMDKLYRETNEAMFEVYDYLTLKLEAMFNGKSDSFPQLFTKEWENHYSSFCPENDLRERRKNDTDVTEAEEDQFQTKTPDDRVNNKKDKKAEGEEKRARKRIQRTDKIEKAKKMKCGRE